MAGSRLMPTIFDQSDLLFFSESARLLNSRCSRRQNCASHFFIWPLVSHRRVQLDLIVPRMQRKEFEGAFKGLFTFPDSFIFYERTLDVCNLSISISVSPVHRFAVIVVAAILFGAALPTGKKTCSTIINGPPFPRFSGEAKPCLYDLIQDEIVGLIQTLSAPLLSSAFVAPIMAWQVLMWPCSQALEGSYGFIDTDQGRS